MRSFRGRLGTAIMITAVIAGVSKRLTSPHFAPVPSGLRRGKWSGRAVVFGPFGVETIVLSDYDPSLPANAGCFWWN